MPYTVQYFCRTLAWFLQPVAGIANYPGRDPGPDANPNIAIPENQRFYVWNLDKQQLFIDSILRGIPIPAIFLAEDRDRRNRRWLLQEGQQRIETAWRFYNNKFSYYGRTFSMLSEDEQRRFLSYQIPIVDISGATEDEMAEIFDRVNGGMPLSNGEKFHNYRRKPLVALAEQLLLTPGTGLHAEATTRWGNYTGRAGKRRDTLANAVGLVAGAAYGASYITNSYPRLCNHLDGLRSSGDVVTPIDPTLVERRLRHLLDVYKRVDDLQPTTQKERGKHWKMGVTSGYILFSILETSEEEMEEIKEYWVEFLKQSRLNPTTLAVLEKDQSNAKNLNLERLQRGWENLLEWCAEREESDVPPPPPRSETPLAEIEESEDEDEDEEDV